MGNACRRRAYRVILLNAPDCYLARPVRLIIVMPLEPTPHLPVLDYASTRRVIAWRTPASLVLAVPIGLVVGCWLSLQSADTWPLFFLAAFICPVALCLLASSRYALVARLWAAGMICAMAACAYLLRQHGRVSMGAWINVSVIALISVVVIHVIAAGVAAIRRAA